MDSGSSGPRRPWPRWASVKNEVEAVPEVPKGPDTSGGCMEILMHGGKPFHSEVVDRAGEVRLTRHAEQLLVSDADL